MPVWVITSTQSPALMGAARALGSIAIVVLFGMALPASWDYVTFMKVESSSYLKIRFDWLYSIYIVFAVAVIARHAWQLVDLWREPNTVPADPPQA